MRALAGYLTLVAAPFVLSVLIRGQQELCSDPQRFAAAVAHHKVELQDLLQTRGIRRLPPQDSLSIARVADLLRQEYATDSLGVLFYSHDGSQLSVWLLTQRGLAACADRMVSRAELAAVTEQLRASLRVDALQANRAPRLRGVSVVRDSARAPIPVDSAVRRVSDLLLPLPLRPALARFPALIVVPVLDIGTVPFAMLRPYGDSTLLVERASIAVAPSLYDPFQRVVPWAAPSRPLVIGNPNLGQHPRFVLPPLPGAEREAERVAALWNTTPVTGPAATRDTVLSLIATKHPDVLYLATHGVADAEDPLNGSFLALAPHGEVSGWWTAQQIQDSRLLGIQLAVLSACQTGLGRVHDAGIIGLARAFQLAGVPRVVMSLWNVDDAATAEFMLEFMRLAKEDTPNNALQETILRMRRRYPAPRVWAAFVLFGSIN